MQKVYFDVCDNLKMFLSITRNTKKNKVYKYARKIKYYLYTKFNLIEEIKKYNEYV